MEEPIGIYRSGPKIQAFFQDCGIQMEIGSSSRVPATREVLSSLLAQGRDEELKRIICKVCDPREYLGKADRATAVRNHMNEALEADGLAVAIVTGMAHIVDRRASGALLEPLVNKVRVLDFDTVQVELARALPNVKDDPEDAVTAACSLLEAVCRSILVEMHLPLPKRRDIEANFRAVQEPLDLSPGRTNLPIDIADDVRQILGGLNTTVKGVGALRTHGGDAHGREKGRGRIDARIALLALNSASTAALFLIETWEKREKRALPLHDE